jgi:predicted phosphodiesterase
MKMRFAAIADVHGNYLALEAVVADIRAQGIGEIVNLGDMASGPLDAGRTMEALMALDAVHVLGNHDRYLIDRPPEKMGLVGPSCARAARRRASRLAAFGAADACVSRSGLSLSRDA